MLLFIDFIPVDFDKLNIYILLVCLFICLYPINVKTTEPIRHIFCVGLHMFPGKVYRWSKFSLNVENPWNFYKIQNFFVFLFYNVYKEKMFTIKIEDRREARILKA